ncbi:hypothetical protein WJX72_011746 [[Myrmecia] bisecta]|uniref:Transposase n=1 Tax=[Myrmecia] bisecta TaxID=41462 RepID=A0AAW1PHE2_9CHLO
MARTKQTARKSTLSTGGKAPRKELMCSFQNASSRRKPPPLNRVHMPASHFRAYMGIDFADKLLLDVLPDTLAQLKAVTYKDATIEIIPDAMALYVEEGRSAYTVKARTYIRKGECIGR